MAQAQSSTQRQLAAVVFLDMVGYSALMQQSEARAQQAVDQLWAIARPLVAEHGGTEVRLFGDGMLLTFGGTVAAAQCCLQVFEQLAEHNRTLEAAEKIAARAGLHLGDIGSRDGEIFGDGVNIAARLVALAPPGGIAISPHVRDQLHNTLQTPIQSLGTKALKNIKQALEVFCLPGPECSAEDLAQAQAAGTGAARLWRFGAASFDERARELSVAGQAVELGKAEIEVLDCLLRHAGEIVTAQELGEVAEVAPTALDDIITTLRERLRDRDATQIKTQPGYGYRLAVQVAVEAAPSQQLTQFDFQPGDHPPLRPLWSLERMLGQGGQGEVWLARHDKTHEARVYKFALDPANLVSLKREITLSRVLQNTSHADHFVRVQDWNLERAPYFIECEYGGSSDLPGWAEAQGGLERLPQSSRLALMIQIADALATAHSVGVLHKDLKPANVLIHQDGDAPPRVKLSDFGSGGVMDAQHLDEAGITNMGFTQSRLYAEDSTAGTPIYVAPELFAGQVATVQADVYALGVMLYQMVVGDLRRPLSAGWEAHIDDELLREDIALAAHGDPAQRLADAASLAQRLRALDARRQQREQEREDQRQAEQAKREAAEARLNLERLQTRRRWGGAVIAALVVGLGLSLYQQQRARQAEQRAVASAQQARQSAQQAREAAQEAEAVAAFLTKDLFATVGDTPLADLTVEELLNNAADKLEQRQEQLPGVAAELHVALGDAFFAMERHTAAEAQFAQALERYIQSGGKGTAETVDTAARLFNFVRLRYADLPKHLPRFQEILAHGRRTLGSAHPAVLSLREHLAKARFFLGDWRGAVDEMLTIIDDQDSENTQPGYRFSVSKTHLGEWHLYLGEFDFANTLQRDVLTELTRTGAPALQRAAAAVYLARGLAELEQFQAAAETLEIARNLVNTWAVESSSMVRITMGLADGHLQLKQNRHAEAVTHLESSISELAKVALIQKTDFTGQFRVWLARAYQGAGRVKKAEDELHRAIDTIEKFHTPRHPLLQDARLVLVELLVTAQRHEEARQMLHSVDRDVLASLGETHPYNAALQRLEGLLALKAGAKARALPALQEALRIYQHVYGDNHSLVQRARRELAQAKES